MNPHQWLSTLPLMMIGLALLPSWQLSAAVLPRQDQQPAAVQEYHFINTQKTATFEKELNDNAGQGWRLYRLPGATGEKSIGALLKRAEAGQKFEYKILATRRISTMEKEFARASEEGWEFRGLISLMRAGDMALSMLANVGGETLIVLERPAGEAKRRYEYRLLSTERESTMQKELDQAVASGYHPLGITRGQDTKAVSMLIGPRPVFTVILGRGSSSPEADQSRFEYRFLSTTRVGTMEKEMNKAAKEGFQYHLSAPDLVTLMKREKESEAQARYAYKLLATRKMETMEKEMTDQIKLGYSYLATTNGLGGLTTVFEHKVGETTESQQRSHLILTSITDSSAEKKIGESLAAGWTLRDITYVSQFVIVFDRPGQPASN